METKLYSRKQIDSGLWDSFIDQSPQRIMYANSGYLDCVCPGWSAVICKDGDQWLGVMPLNICRKVFQEYSLKPALIQYLGIFFSRMDEKMHRLIHLKKIIIESIIKTIPQNLKLFNHNFSPEFDYFIPFCWNKFEVRPFHSYHLSLDNSLPEIYSDFSKSVTKRIAGSEKLNLKCIENNSVVNLVNMMIERRIIDRKTGDKFEELWKFIDSKEKGFTIYITNPVTNQIYCGGAFLVDYDRVIFLASALDYRFKKTGAHPLLVWKGIQRAHRIAGIKIFDFEGSMIEGIENYTRSFGASPIVYYNISRNNLALPYSLGFALKEKIQKKEKLKTIEKLVTAD